MRDAADLSQEHIDTYLASAIAAARRGTQLESDGHCAFCDEPVPVGMVFCDRDSRDDYERLKRSEAISGKPF